MTPTHHPEPEELLAYASGASPEWISLVVACHLTYCGECRKDVGLFEDLGGAMLEALEEPGGQDGQDGQDGHGEDDALSFDDVVERPPRDEPVRAKASNVPGLPRPLDAYFRDQPAKWRFLAPGLQQIPLSFSVGGVPARIIRFKSGYRIPEHAHQGLEMVLVLDGELEDGVTREVFRTGDLSRRESGTSHDQRILGGEPCICLVVSAAPVRPATFMGRILKALTGV